MNPKIVFNVLFLLISLASVATRAQEAREIGLPAGPLADAIAALSVQTGVQIFAPSELVARARVPELRGRYTAESALAALVADRGLEVQRTGPQTLTLARPSGALARRPIEEITVTGTTVPFETANVDLVRTEDDPQPYRIFSGNDVARANTVNLEDFFKQRLTMNTIKGTEAQRGGVSPTSSVNLRGLGGDETLILVNGRRVGDAQFDVNSIATPSMIERIDVLPSSASAIYGGSAIGGVINIVLKRDFVGGDVQLAYDTPADVSAPIRSASAGYGWSFEGGRTNISVRAGYRDLEPLLVRDRVQLQARGSARVLEHAPELLYTAASPARYGTTPNIASADGSPLVLDDGTALGSSLTYVPPGTSPWTSAAELATGLLRNAGRQNTTPAEHTEDWGNISGLDTQFETTSEAKSAALALRRRMTERLELTAEATFNSNEGWLRFSPLLGWTAVPASAPTNPFRQDVTLSVPVPTAFDHRHDLINTYRQESTRLVAGFVLDLPRAWRLQGDYTWNRTEKPFLYRINPDWDGQAGAFANGTLDPFVDTLAHPLDLSPFYTPAFWYGGNSRMTLDDVGLRASGPLGELRGGRPTLTVGIGRRKEAQPWEIFGQGGALERTTSAQFQRAAHVYGEILLPLVSGQSAVAGVRQLDLQLAARYEDYLVNSAGVDSDNDRRIGYTTFNQTVGLRYKPAEALTLRASAATAFLPPGFRDLRPDPLREAGPVFATDPLRGNEQVFAVRLTGGNPDIEPMESKSVNVGLIFEPARLQGLRVGVEWYRIERDHLIMKPSAFLLLANEALYPERVTRAVPEPGDIYGVGRVVRLDERALNAQHVSTDGFDLSVGFEKATPRGAFSVDVLATVIGAFTRVLDPSSPEVDIVGRVNDERGPLERRANATLGWQNGPWNLSWTVLYYGSYEQIDDPLYIAAQGGRTVPSQVYHNLLGSYAFGERGEVRAERLMSNVTFTLGVRNAFDKLPPFDASAVEFTPYYSTYGEARLRTVQFAVAKQF